MHPNYKNSYKVEQKELLSLAVYNVGYQKCDLMHQWGPGVRDHYLIHYVISGKGYYKTNGKKYTLEAGDSFLVYPNREVTYFADHGLPWEYAWVGFNGSDALSILNATNFTPEHPIIQKTPHGEEILHELLRIYEVRGNEFERAVEGLRERVPGIEISTDVICGFPTETDEDFAGTLGLIEKHRFSFVNINAMFVRPGTPAARMERVPGKVVKARAAAMHNLFHSYQTFDHMVGKRYKVWITERAHDGKSWAAHTKSYVQVLLDGDDPRITPGSTAMVEVTEASKWSVRGKLVE